jgi:hypothetical protein
MTPEQVRGLGDAMARAQVAQDELDVLNRTAAELATIKAAAYRALKVELGSWAEVGRAMGVTRQAAQRTGTTHAD